MSPVQSSSAAASGCNPSNCADAACIHRPFIRGWVHVNVPGQFVEPTKLLQKGSSFDSKTTTRPATNAFMNSLMFISYI